MPTLKDVAALAGVSAATVSLYLNGKSAGRISQQKQKEIEEALKQLSYQPSSASRQLKELGTSPLIYTVAVYWAADPRSALLGKVMAGIQSSLAKNQMTNCNIVICPFKPNELYKEKGLIDEAVQLRCCYHRKYCRNGHAVLRQYYAAYPRGPFKQTF